MKRVRIITIEEPGKERVEVIIKVQRSKAWKDDFEKLFENITDKITGGLQDIYRFSQIKLK